ncbi:MAG: hypothetical protein ACFFD7_15275 [Candidatus Thorarchaeota archaeon]
MLKKIFRKRIKEIHEKFEKEKILIHDDTVNFFGLESLGIWKIHGNGVLILTENVLMFGMWKPKRDLTIPVKSIIKIENPKPHLHRSVFKPLLKVNFKNEKGNDDSAAWFVSSLDKWKENFENIIPKEV